MAEEEGQVIAVKTVDSWKDRFQKGKDSKKLVVVDFTASWCGPCRFMAPILEELAKKMPHVIFLKVDVDELSSVSEEWSIEAMPTFLFLKEGELVDKVVGANKDQLHATIEKHAASPVVTSTVVA
ncbi:thioredoxin H1-like [Vigna umbellata]|uniref:thioredoxin H1-like n=1 Tax=Vigna umbellata TaxID=87088 RepID=UPI001F5FDB89|nr:thioredoxin H1-like [Vigna umbellata]